MYACSGLHYGGQGAAPIGSRRGACRRGPVHTSARRRSLVMALSLAAGLSPAAPPRGLWPLALLRPLPVLPSSSAASASPLPLPLPPLSSPSPSPAAVAALLPPPPYTPPTTVQLYVQPGVRGGGRTRAHRRVHHGGAAWVGCRDGWNDGTTRACTPHSTAPLSAYASLVMGWMSAGWAL